MTDSMRARRWGMARLLPCFFVLWWGVGAAAMAASPPTWPIDWQVERYRDHPLAGRIWSPPAQTWVSPKQLRAAVSDARFVLLGETHDNPDHHRLQAQLLQAMVAAGRAPVVAFEMLDLNQQPALETFLQSHPDDAAGLGSAVGWAESGWPAWVNYEPIAEVALAHRLRIVAANLPTDKVKAVAFKGYDALDPERIEELGLRKPWPKSRSETMREELYASHCKLVPKAALTGMIHAQRTRNAIMAWRLEKTAGASGAVLIAGAGHARRDYGVPLNLRDDAPGASVLSVALVEVNPDKRRPSDYAADYNVHTLPYDYVLFTPAAAREDPCMGLKKRFEKIRKKGGSS